MIREDGSREDYVAVLEQIAGIGVWEWDVADDVVTWSDGMYRIFHVKPEYFDPTFDRNMASVHPDDRASVTTYVERAMADRVPFAADYRVIVPGGDERWVHCRGQAVEDESGDVVRILGTAQDITDRKEVEFRLAVQALHDSLTRLPNRSLLLDRLTHAMQRTLRTKRHTAVFFIDLDRFKHINDGAGHETGDEVLRTIASRLRRAVRQHDTVARYGGDEFVVIAEELQWPAEAIEVARRLLETVRTPIDHESGELVVTASIGAVVADARPDPNAALRDADSAMYQAKNRGGDRVVWLDNIEAMPPA